MRQEFEGIAVFLAMRFATPPAKEVKKQIEQLVLRERGNPEDCKDPNCLMARFTSASCALAALDRVQRSFSSTEDHPAVGLELGEILPGHMLSNNSAFGRSQELAGYASHGQNLVGPAAREVLRPSLPAGFGLLELGELRLGRSISAERVSQLNAKGPPTEFPRIEALDEVLSNVPEIHDFIGRDAESRQVTRALAESQLVTLLGPAGVGKSTLANWICADLAESYRDGTWLVDLGKIPRGGNVATAIAADLKLPMMPNHSAEDRVLIGLAAMQGLVWLDNCEHVVEQLRDLLPKMPDYCARVRFLATTRIKLNLEIEKVLPIHPFAIPEDPDKYEDSEAVRLFVNRARRASAEFVVTHEALETAVQICRRVDGLPLAIELAAAQIARMPIGTLSKRLREALGGPGEVTNRHKTLDRALAWSYSLLEPQEQKFFRGLGVLAGPAGLELALSAGSVGQGTDEERNSKLKALVDASLVVDESTKSVHRYRLLEPVRQFALSQLEREGEEAKARKHFLKTCLAWVAKLADSQMAANRFSFQLGREYANLESALVWGLEAPGTGSDCLALAHQLYKYWLWNGPYDKGADYLERAIEKGKRLDGVLPGNLYNQLGLLEGYAGRYDKSEAAFKKALELFKKEGLRRRMAAAYTNFAIHTRNSGDLERALDYGRKSLEYSDDDDPNLMKLLGNFATDLAEAGCFQEARVHLERAMFLNESIGDPEFIATHHSTAAYLDLMQNNTSSAEQHLNRSLAYYRLSGDIQGLLSTIEFAAMFALRFGEYERAAKLLGGTELHFQKAGVGRNIPDLRRRDQMLETIHAMLGKETAEAHYFRGAVMSIDELYDFARSGPDFEHESQLL